MRDFSFAGKVVLVVGGTSGIGLATVRLLMDAGADVVIAGRRDVKSIAADRGARTCQLDITDEAQIVRALEEIRTSVGAIDGLVNSAGVENTGSSLAEAPLDHWSPVLDVNLIGLSAMIKHGSRHMKAGGSIVNIASVAATVGIAGYGHYAASKAAVLSLTRTAAIELAAEKIRVNAISPGPVATAMVPPDHPEVKLAQGLVPMARIARPEEIATVVQFLLSDASSYMTGQCLNVDGGLSAGLSSRAVETALSYIE